LGLPFIFSLMFVAKVICVIGLCQGLSPSMKNFWKKIPLHSEWAYYSHKSPWRSMNYQPAFHKSISTHINLMRVYHTPSVAEWARHPPSLFKTLYEG
jgi:hypothetical protein